ncbi:MAG: asparaginase [bacterium]
MKLPPQANTASSLLKSHSFREPLHIEVLRGPTQESLHLVHAAVVDPAGRVENHWGNIDFLTFPRSAVKPLQAVPLLLSGAADRFELSNVELALACASHGAEAAHLKAVSAWLERLGYDPENLECGTHWPSHEDSAHALAHSGGTPSALHNNCSGKHTGFLTLARQLNVDPQGYVHPEHPVQQEIRKSLEFFMGIELTHAPMGIDGCSIPTWAVPLKFLARGFARFAGAPGLPAEYQSACQRLRSAMLAEPFYVAGTGRHCTRVMQAFGEQVVCKIGAEGVYAASIPKLGLGVALKAQDGSFRAAEVALSYILTQLELAPTDANFTVEQPLFNRNQIQVGEVRLARAAHGQ